MFRGPTRGFSMSELSDVKPSDIKRSNVKPSDVKGSDVKPSDIKRSDVKQPAASERASRATRSVEEDECEEELHGEYERDESETPDMAKRSFLAKVTMDDHQRFLNLPPMTRGDALRGMSVLDRMIYEMLILLSSLTWLATIWQYAQKSALWLWARTGRITGSTTAAAVGHQRGTPVCKAAYQSMWTKFKGNVASEWGSGKEVYGTQCYVNDLLRIVVTEFRKQRREGKVQKTMTFVFRGQTIPVPDIDQDPVVEVRHYGLLIDPWNHHRGVSPDGVVFINDVACGALEVKCAYADLFALYVNIHPYYYDQIMCELYLCNRYWPTIRWLDFQVWAPKNFVVDTYTLNTDYFFHWYGPRENRYYFRLFLKAMSEKMCFMAEQETKPGVKPTDEHVQSVMKRQFAMPVEPPADPMEDQELLSMNLAF